MMRERMAAIEGGAFHMTPGLYARANGMTGLICVSPKITWTFQPHAGVSETHVVAKFIDATMWVSSNLIVPVQSKSIAANQRIEVIVNNTLDVQDDPASEYVEATARATVTIDSSTPATVPGLPPLASLTTPIGAHLRVSVKGTQAAGVTTVFSATFAVYLVGRPA
jgi:hypothetical protein